MSRHWLAVGIPLALSALVVCLCLYQKCTAREDRFLFGAVPGYYEGVVDESGIWDFRMHGDAVDPWPGEPQLFWNGVGSGPTRLFQRDFTYLPPYVRWLYGGK